MHKTQQVIAGLRRLGLNQPEIQRRTGIPQSRLSRWEGGCVPAGADDALRLKELLDELSAAQAAASTSAPGETHAAA